MFKRSKPRTADDNHQVKKDQELLCFAQPYYKPR